MNLASLQGKTGVKNQLYSYVLATNTWKLEFLKSLFLIAANNINYMGVSFRQERAFNSTDNISRRNGPHSAVKSTDLSD